MKTDSSHYDAVLEAEKYIDNMDSSLEIIQTGITKDYYLDMMELAVNAYKKEELELRVHQQELIPIQDIQAFSRITSVVGILLAQGRISEYDTLWEKMMDQCCRDIGNEREDQMADFAMKEIMLVFKAMGDKVTPSKKAEWTEKLTEFNPYTAYQLTLEKTKASDLHNILIYNLAGEYLRETEGFVDTTDYFERHWPTQFERFDENGMYADPGAPILYDLTTRVQMQLILGNGYKGKFADRLDGYLKKAGLMTLFMQSPCFELPYGGRSNQYLFNEALIAANCEYEASRYKRLGDMKKAMIFKRSAHLAVKSLKRWLDEKPPKHIKNFYSIDSKYGTENYGYYDKYMMTMGNFIYIAYLFSDDSIPESLCPAELGGYVFKTSPSFHKVFANSNHHGLEIDYKADTKYDSTGIGRYHRMGIPTELALSIPFSDHPAYELTAAVLKGRISISAGWEYESGNIQYLSELSDGLNCNFLLLRQNQKEVVFRMEYTGSCIKGCDGFSETYTINQKGVAILAELINPIANMIYYQLPLLATNGKNRTVLSTTVNCINLNMDNYAYQIITDGIISVDPTQYGNRNGEYNMGRIQKDGAVVHVQLLLTSHCNP
jgi:hypothetical protein